MVLDEWRTEFETEAPGVDHEHKTGHDRLLDEPRDLMDDCEAGRWVDRAAFAARVAQWFSVHFDTRDVRLHRRLG